MCSMAAAFTGSHVERIRFVEKAFSVVVDGRKVDRVARMALQITSIEAVGVFVAGADAALKGNWLT